MAHLLDIHTLHRHFLSLLKPFILILCKPRERHAEGIFTIPFPQPSLNTLPLPPPTHNLLHLPHPPSPAHNHPGWHRIVKEGSKYLQMQPTLNEEATKVGKTGRKGWAMLESREVC